MLGLMKSILPAGLILAFLVWTLPAAIAHHSLAELFDRESMITVTGTVSRVTWVNPHVVFHLDVADESGGVRDWTVEMDPPHVLARRGWSPETLAAGDEVTVTGFRSRDGSPGTEAETVRLATGERLVASSEGSWNWGPRPDGAVLEFGEFGVRFRVPEPQDESNRR